MTKAHAFCETFGTPLHNVERVWSLLNEEGLQPPNRSPKHSLWALHFMKCYPLQTLGCEAIGASSRVIDPRTHQKWVWVYIEAITNLVDIVVSIFDCCIYFFLDSCAIA